MNGDKYDGEWLNNDKHGHGEYTYNGGDTYKGDFAEGLKSGHGVY